MKRFLPSPADVFLLTGASLLSYGAWLVYDPAGYLMPGALLILAGLARGRAEALRGTKK